VTRLTGSRLDMAELCPYSMALPGIETSGKAATSGVHKHRYLQCGEAHPDVATECELIDLPKAVPEADGGDLREATFGLGPDGEIVFIGVDQERDYSGIPDGFIPLTIDRTFQAKGVTWVVDYKTGSDAPSPNTLQLAAGAVCISQHWLEQDVSVAIVHVVESGDVYWYIKEYDLFSLRAAELRIRRVYDAVEEARLHVAEGRPIHLNQGQHCRYCPARQQCPTTTALVHQITGTSDPADLVKALPIEKLGEAWVKLGLAKAFVEDLDKSLRGRIEELGGCTLPDGVELVPAPTTYKSIDWEQAQPVFKAMGIDIAPKVSIGNEAVELAAKRAGIKKAKLWKDLVEAGAVKMTNRTNLRRKHGSKIEQG